MEFLRDIELPMKGMTAPTKPEEMTPIIIKQTSFPER